MLYLILQHWQKLYLKFLKTWPSTSRQMLYLNVATRAIVIPYFQIVQKLYLKFALFSVIPRECLTLYHFLNLKV